MFYVTAVYLPINESCPAVANLGGLPCKAVPINIKLSIHLKFILTWCNLLPCAKKLTTAYTQQNKLPFCGLFQSTRSLSKPGIDGWDRMAKR